MPSYRALHEDIARPAFRRGGRQGAGHGRGLRSDAAALRAADLVALFKAGLATGWQPEPVIDGVVLKRQLAETFARGEQAKVPVLAGFNEGEIRSLLFLMPKAPDSQAAYEADVRRRFGARAVRYLAVYPGVDPKADVMASIRDGLYGWAAQISGAATGGGGAAGLSLLLPAQHAGGARARPGGVPCQRAALYFRPGRAVRGARAELAAPPLTSAEAQLSDAMMSYWTSFVRDGVPKAPGQPPWPRYTARDRAYLDIDDRPSARRDLQPAAFACADALVADRRQQGRGWRLDIGFSAFSVDAPGAGGQPTAAMSNIEQSNAQERAPSRRPRARNHKARVREASIARILDAAEQLFAEFGYHGVTLKDVAARVGVSSTLIHYHFKGKESIYEAVWARRAPLSARNRLEAMRRYAEEVGDNVTVEGALRGLDRHRPECADRRRGAMGRVRQDRRAGQQRRRLGRREDDEILQSGRARADRPAQEGDAGLRRGNDLLGLSLRVGRDDSQHGAHRPAGRSVARAVLVLGFRVDPQAHGAVHGRGF